MEKVNAGFTATTGEYNGITYDQYLGKARLVSVGSGKALTKSNEKTYHLVNVEFDLNGETVNTDASVGPEVYATLTAGDVIAISGRKGDDSKNYFSVLGVAGTGLISDDLFDKIVASATITQSAPSIEA
jgi:hypothetical protein